MTDTPTSLTSKLWGFAMSILGVAVAIMVIVNVIRSVWMWLVVIAVVVLGFLLAARVLVAWRERGRW